MVKPERPEFCALCGEKIPPAARACPGCGADERNGWREANPSDGLDLPENDFDPDKFHREEFGRTPGGRPAWLTWRALAIVLLIVVLAAMYVGRY